MYGDGHNDDDDDGANDDDEDDSATRFVREKKFLTKRVK
jgi:hypothetical protein